VTLADVLFLVALALLVLGLAAIGVRLWKLEAVLHRGFDESVAATRENTKVFLQVVETLRSARPEEGESPTGRIVAFRRPLPSDNSGDAVRPSQPGRPPRG
jgi:hypothetical protein